MPPERDSPKVGRPEATTHVESRGRLVTIYMLLWVAVRPRHNPECSKSATTTRKHLLS
jgi:hypothetical protein